MKKLIICLLAVAISGQIQCQTLDKIISDFSKVENVENVNIGKFGCSFLKMASIGNKDLGIVNKISAIHVIDLSGCTREIKNKFANEIDGLNYGKYELLLKAKDEDGNEVLIISKAEKDKIRELVIIDKEDPTIVRLKGNFDLDDLTDCTSLKL